MVHPISSVKVKITSLIEHAPFCVKLALVVLNLKSLILKNFFDECPFARFKYEWHIRQDASLNSELKMHVSDTPGKFVSYGHIPLQFISVRLM